MPEGKVRFAALSPDGTRLFCGVNEGKTTQFALLDTTSGKESYLFSSDRTNFVQRDAGGEHVYLERPDPIGVLAVYAPTKPY